MKQGDFEGKEGAKAPCLSDSQFGIAIHGFDDGLGNLLFGSEPVEDEVSVRPKRACHGLEGFEPRTHDPRAPSVEEPASPRGGTVAPECLEGFFVQIGPDGTERMAEDVDELVDLGGSKVLRPLEETPTRVFERQEALAAEILALFTADFVHGLVQALHDVEAVQDMDGLRCPAGNDLDACLPHVTRDEF